MVICKSFMNLRKEVFLADGKGAKWTQVETTTARPTQKFQRRDGLEAVLHSLDGCEIFLPNGRKVEKDFLQDESGKPDLYPLDNDDKLLTRVKGDVRGKLVDCIDRIFPEN